MRLEAAQIVDIHDLLTERFADTDIGMDVDLRVAEEEPERVPIAGDRMRARFHLGTKPIGEGCRDRVRFRRFGRWHRRECSSWLLLGCGGPSKHVRSELRKMMPNAPANPGLFHHVVPRCGRNLIDYRPV